MNEKKNDEIIKKESNKEVLNLQNEIMKNKEINGNIEDINKGKINDLDNKNNEKINNDSKNIKNEEKKYSNIINNEEINISKISISERNNKPNNIELNEINNLNHIKNNKIIKPNNIISEELNKSYNITSEEKFHLENIKKSKEFKKIQNDEIVHSNNNKDKEKKIDNNIIKKKDSNKKEKNKLILMNKNEEKIKNKLFLLKIFFVVSISINICDIIVIILYPLIFLDLINIICLIIITITLIIILIKFILKNITINLNYYKIIEKIFICIIIVIAIDFFNILYIMIYKILLNAVTDFDSNEILLGIFLVLSYCLLNIFSPIIILIQIGKIKFLILKLLKNQKYTLTFSMNSSLSNLVIQKNDQISFVKNSLNGSFISK
jgi:hypothetical protein